MTTTEFLIIGAGITGLSLARELRIRNPKCKIIILEKESCLGQHASGRNSGVLHSGIFYAEDSIKAKVCAQGAKALANYCAEHHLPIKKEGKVILPVGKNDSRLLEKLYERATLHGIPAFLIDAQALKKIEPFARLISGKAIHIPDASIVEPVEILNHLAKELIERDVEIRFNAQATTIHPVEASLEVSGETISFGHLFNCAGAYADKVAKRFGVGEQYAIMPFKGLYYRVAPSSGLSANGLIYALPDPNVPFLGIHFMKNFHNETYAGPTVLPAFGRENYRALEGFKLLEAGSIAVKLLQLYYHNPQGFRKLVHREGFRFLKYGFYSGARKLVPNLKMRDLLPTKKVGIRAQLVDVKAKKLVMDFVVEQGPRSTHILNAVSPAFTSSFAFAQLVLDKTGIG